MISFSALEAAASYDNPLALLHACHGKILAQCVTLQKLSSHLNSNGCDLQAQQAAQKILHYFDTSGQFHHQDEEENLFPPCACVPALTSPVWMLYSTACYPSMP